MRKMFFSALAAIGVAAGGSMLYGQFDDLDAAKPSKAPAKAPGKGSAKPAAKQGGGGAVSGVPAGIRADFLFDYAQYRAKGLPGYCNCFVVLRSPQKPRPLFITGRGKEGVVTLSFDNDDGMSEKSSLSLKGSGSCIFGGYNTSGASDGPTYSGYDWFRVSPVPEVILTVSGIKDLKPRKDSALAELLNSNRDDRKKPEAVECDAKADIAVEVRGKTTVCKNTPVTVILNDGGGHWAFWVRTTISFTGADLGLTGDDAGAVTMKVVMAGFSQPPKGFGSSPVKVDEMMKKTTDKEMFDL